MKIGFEMRLDLLMKVGCYDHHILGDPESAEKRFEEAVDLATKLFPDLVSNLKLAKAHENLAKCYISTSNLNKSELHVKKALEIKVHLYGQVHPETALSFYDMGNVSFA